MSSDMLKYAYEIREAAKELEMEAAKKKIYLEDVEEDDTPELTQYRQALKSFVQAHENYIPYLDFFKVLMNINLMSKQSIARNQLVNHIQSEIDKIRRELKESDVKPSKHTNLPVQVSDFLRKFDKKQQFKDLKKHPAYKLFKEILNYLVVRGNTQFARLFVQPGNFHNTFLSQKEKQKIRQQEKTED